MSAGLWWELRLPTSKAVPGHGAKAPLAVVPTTVLQDRRRVARVGVYRFPHTRREHWLTPWCLSRAKRIFDLAGALSLLLLTLPLLLVIAVAIKLDSPGPVLFRQLRTGLAGRRFRMYKFRSMRRDAEKLKASLRKLSHHGTNSPDFKIRNDPRVTRLGRFLRRSSIDEIPNLINVLRGEMSLVGPRPTSFDIDAYSDRHLARLAVPPGVTGLWQISGRSDIDFDDRVRLDCRYIEQQSAWLDLKILLLTPFRAFSGRGAC